MMRQTALRLAVLGVLLWAQPVSAEVRTILVVPINFQNDTTQPRTLAQLRTDAETLSTKVFANSYGTVTTTVTVLNYLTIAVNKGCPGNGGVLPILDMIDVVAKVDAGLAARGESSAGYTYPYLVSPTTFSKCSHTASYSWSFATNFDFLMSADETATTFVWRFGLGMSTNLLCRAAAGSSTFVTLSNYCGPSPSSASGRDFTSLSGQGGGSLTAYDRNRLAWLPGGQQTTVAVSTGTWTITRLENPAAGTKRLLIPAMGVELTYHAPSTSIGWDTRGVTAHLINTSKRLDFTPDDRWLFGTTALATGLSWTYNGLRLTTLSADANWAVVDLRTVATTPPVVVIPPVVVPPAPVVVTAVTYTTLTPADAVLVPFVSAKLGVPTSVQSNAVRAEFRWTFGTNQACTIGNTAVLSTTKTGDVFSHKERASSPGPRCWSYRLFDASGAYVDTPRRLIQVTP